MEELNFRWNLQELWHLTDEYGEMFRCKGKLLYGYPLLEQLLEVIRGENVLLDHWEKGIELTIPGDFELK